MVARLPALLAALAVLAGCVEDSRDRCAHQGGRIVPEGTRTTPGPCTDYDHRPCPTLTYVAFRCEDATWRDQALDPRTEPAAQASLPQSTPGLAGTARSWHPPLPPPRPCSTRANSSRSS
jgi:hypothetical protein